jgi:hypothetical protein
MMVHGMRALVMKPQNRWDKVIEAWMLSILHDGGNGMDWAGNTCTGFTTPISAKKSSTLPV